MMPVSTRFGSTSTPGTLSRMMLGSGRGCATVTSVTITPSTGGMIGRMVFCFGSNIPTLYSGGGARGGGARHDRRRGLRVVEQPALCPADENAAGAVLQRVGGIEAPAR